MLNTPKCVVSPFQIRVAEGIPAAYVVTVADDESFRFVVDTIDEALRIVECAQALRAARNQIKLSKSILIQHDNEGEV